MQEDNAKSTRHVVAFTVCVCCIYKVCNTYKSISMKPIRVQILLILINGTELSIMVIVRVSYVNYGVYRIQLNVVWFA